MMIDNGDGADCGGIGNCEEENDILTYKLNFQLFCNQRKKNYFHKRFHQTSFSLDLRKLTIHV